MPKEQVNQAQKSTKVKPAPSVDAFAFVHKSIKKHPWTRFVLPIYNRKWLLLTTLLAFTIFLSGILMFSLGHIATINKDSKNTAIQITNALRFWAPAPGSTLAFDIVIIILGLFLFLGALFMLMWNFDFFHWFKIPKINKRSFSALLAFNILYFASCLLLLVTLIAIIFNVLTIATWGHVIYHLY